MSSSSPKSRLSVSLAATGLAVAMLALSGCAPYSHRHVDSRGQLTSSTVTGYGYGYGYAGYYDPYGGYAYNDYYRPNYYRHGNYARQGYGCDRNTDPYRNIGFENGYSYGYAPCNRGRRGYRDYSYYGY
jgi:hypothetical protein